MIFLMDIHFPDQLTAFRMKADHEVLPGHGRFEDRGLHRGGDLVAQGLDPGEDFLGVFELARVLCRRVIARRALAAQAIILAVFLGGAALALLGLPGCRAPGTFPDGPLLIV